jgi:hypothetical protein
MYVVGPVICETANWISQITTRKTRRAPKARRTEYATSDISSIVRPPPPFRKRTELERNRRRRCNASTSMIRIGLVTTVAALSLLAAACASSPSNEITLYLKRDIGSSAPPGQIVPVLAPAVRRVDSQQPSPARVLAVLQQGPTSDEADEGFLPTIPSSVHILGVQVSNGTATVNFGGSAPQAFYTHAAIVLSLTELPGIKAVALRSNGEPCCVYTLDGKVAPAPITRRLYRGWPGEPCALRTYADAVVCRGDA